MSKPIGMKGTPMSNPRIVAAVAGRIVLGLAVVAVLAGEPSASAHNPSVSIACQGTGRASVAVLDVDLVSYGNGGHVNATVDGQTLYSRDFVPGDYHASNRVGSGYVDHAVTVAVTAPDDTDGSRGWTRTFRLVTPPCKTPPHRDVVHPIARLYGPFLDPMYYARFDNRGSDVACTFRWYRTDGGKRKVITRTVAAGHTQSTKLRHADGGTMQTITACGELLVTHKTAPGGNYPAPR